MLFFNLKSRVVLPVRDHLSGPKVNSGDLPILAYPLGLHLVLNVFNVGSELSRVRHYLNPLYKSEIDDSVLCR